MMMTMTQITEILKCSRVTAERALRSAGIMPNIERFAHGRKHYYNVTADQLPDIIAQYKTDPEQIAAQQGAALMALESALRGLSHGY